MIANNVIGRSFKGALLYSFMKEHSNFGFSNLAHRPEDGINKMASELIAVASQRPNLSRSVAHVQFSPNPDDDISDEKFEKYIKRWLEKMGYKNCLYAVAFHSDTAIRHAHLVISRVTLDNQVVSESNNYARNLKVSRQLEKEFGLIVTTPSLDGEKPTPKWQRDKAVAPNDYIKEAIKAVGASGPTMPDFIKGLQGLGIDAQVSFHSNTEDPSGIAFKYDNVAVTGSKIGYSFKKIQQKLGVTYESGHRDAIHRLQDGNAAVHGKGAGSSEVAAVAGTEQFEKPVDHRQFGTVDPDKGRRDAAAKRIKAAAERRKSAADEFTKERNNREQQRRDAGIFQKFRGVIGKIKRTVESLGAVIGASKRVKLELPTVADQFARNNKSFREIFKTLESTDLYSMKLKRQFFREIKSNIDEDKSLDM
jgi:hypothetical protein